ncbi:MAG: hypothetical protein HYY17_00660 [Planctomycetes bacterium]|nr:hypothetical protein [Planctomycetota bacterium]
MTVALVLLLSGGVEIDAAGSSRKKDKAWELVLSGRTKGLPEGAVVTMRFTRLENRVRWKDRSIATVAAETSWVRKAYVEKKVFSHVEAFPGPCEVGVEMLFLPDDQEAPDLRREMGLDYRPHKTAREFRVGRPQDAAPILKKDREALLARADEARRILRAMIATESRDELSKLKKELEKLLQKVRDDRTLLAGSARAMAAVLQDLYNSVGAMPKSDKDPKPDKGGEHSGGTSGPTSSLTGESLTLEKVGAIVDELVGVSSREAALLLFRWAGSLCSEAAEARKSRLEAAAWGRRREELRKDLAAVLGAWRDLGLAIDGMAEYLQAAETFVRGIVAAVDGGAADPEPPDEEKAKELEKRLRRSE